MQEPVCKGCDTSSTVDQLGVTLMDDAIGGTGWQICSGGVCLLDRSGPALMEKYRALRLSQGRPVPLG